MVLTSYPRVVAMLCINRHSPVHFASHWKMMPGSGTVSTVLALVFLVLALVFRRRLNYQKFLYSVLGGEGAVQ